MCTYITERIDVAGSGKGPDGWMPVSRATVYYDHPVHAPFEHSLSIDVLNPGLGPAARVAVELDVASARALAEAILRTLERVPADLLAAG
jgi:hypothetical protein